uniref:Uncharacterized protein n=1 Tax=Spumella elongata TaxID=89044 RepID=A0A7S3HLB0_9STRA|eukprot:gene19046-21664_t
MANADPSGMYVFGALCCCNTLISTDIAHFIGCAGISECLCIHEEFCLKANTAFMPCVIGPASGYLCKIGIPCCAFGIKIPTVLLKGKSSCFCLTTNCAFPPDADTPLMLAVYGLMCFPVIGCCNKFGTVPKTKVMPR